MNNIILDSISLQDRIFLESIPADNCLDTIVEAMKKGRRVHIGYRKYASDEITARMIEPYFIKLHKRRWYVIARQIENGKLKMENSAGAQRDSGFRTFSFDRIVDAVISKEKFTIPKDFDAKAYFDDCFGVMRDERYPAQRIVLRALNREKFYMEDLPVHHTQRKIAEGDGYTDYEVCLRPTSDFIAYVLSRGAWLKVMEPKSVVQMVTDNITAMSKLYE